MYRLRRILMFVFLSLSLAGCGSSGEDSDSELQVEVDCSATVLNLEPPGQGPRLPSAVNKPADKPDRKA